MDCKQPQSLESDGIPPKFADRATFSPNELAIITGLSRGKVYQLIRERKMPTIALSERRLAISRRVVSQLINGGITSIESMSKGGENDSEKISTP